MTRLELSFLGPFEAFLDQERITTFKSNKVRALLAYLAVEADRSHPRESLAELLWPGWPAKSAMDNLRFTLADLRKNIGDRESQSPFLLVSRESIQLNPDTDVWMDVREFEQGIGGRIEGVISLYRGPFLEGFSLADSPAFEQWVLQRREHFSRLMFKALSTWVEFQTQQGEFAQALPYAYRAVELEPWREEAHQQLMRLLALSGQRSEALAQFEICRQLLQAELSIEPSADTLRLFQAIRDETLTTVETGMVSEELPPAPGLPPFKGLQYFDEADASLFFGRQELAARLVGNVAEMASSHPAEEDQPGCVLTVVGASGSGKSSVVRAGLIPALKRGQLPSLPSAGWMIRVTTPSTHPLQTLAVSLTQEVESVNATATLMDDMAREYRSLALYAEKRLLRASSPQAGEVGTKPGRLLLVIDQFEELFTLCRSEVERQAFVDNLMLAASAGVLVVIVLRADFYAHCARYPHLRQALSDRQEYIGPMSASELRQAIEEPARLGGWDFAPGLVDLFLRDVGASEEHPPEPGALPLLEHALLETWQRRSGKTLTLRGYADAGGVQGAVAHTAESVYARLKPEQQALARRIFLRLTELGEGTQDTRRRVAMTELVPDPGEAPLVESLLKDLADARLITLAEDTAEVAHEALIREWPALRKWLSEDREGLRLHRHLTEAAQAWQAMRRDPGELYRGARLVQALEWAEQPGHAQELNLAEQEFMAASQKLAEQEAQEREAQRQRELEAAQKLAETERKNAEAQRHSAQRLHRRAFYLAGAMGLAVVLLAAAVLIAMAERRSARLATARQHAAIALANLTIDPPESISQALRSLQIQPSAQAYSALHQAVFANHLRDRLVAHQGVVYGVAVSPDGTRLATIGTDRTLKVWRLNGTAIEQPPILTVENIGVDEAHLKNITFNPDPLQFSPDGKYLAVANQIEEGALSIKIVDSSSGKQDQQIYLSFAARPYFAITDMVYSPDGSLLGICAEQCWFVDAVSGFSVRYYFTPGNYIQYNLTFRQDGMIATGGIAESGIIEVKLWGSFITALSSGELVAKATLTNTEGVPPVYSIRLSQDGSRLAYTTLDAVHIVDLTPLASGGSPIEKVTIPLEYRWDAVLFLAGNERLATVDLSGRITIWDAENGQPLYNLLPEAPLRSAATSPDQRILFTAHTNGEVLAWDVSGPRSPDWLAVPTGGVQAGLILSPDGATLLEWNRFGGVDQLWQFTRWQINGGQVLQSGRFTIDLGPIGDFSTIHHGLTRIAFGYPDYSDWVVKVIDAVTGEVIQILHLGPGLSSFRLDSSGDRLFVARSYGNVDVWKVDSASQITSFRVTPFQAIDLPIYLDLSQDESRLLTWGEVDTVVRLWDSATGQLVQEFSRASSAICDPSLTIDNRFLLTCGADRTALIWEATTGKLVRSIPLPDMPDRVQASPDLHYLVASLISSQTTIYDFASGRELARLPASSSPVSIPVPSRGSNVWRGYVARPTIDVGYLFSVDGKYVLIASPADQMAYGFILDNNDLVDLACERLAVITLTDSNGKIDTLPICKNSP